MSYKSLERKWQKKTKQISIGLMESDKLYDRNHPGMALRHNS